MGYKICYWDSDAKEQRERDATPEEAAEIDSRKAAAAPVPQTVTKRQGMAELIDRDLLAAVQGMLDGLPGKAGALARNDFANSQDWERGWPLIAQCASALGWSDAFVDELFIGAKAR